MTNHSHEAAGTRGTDDPRLRLYSPSEVARLCQRSRSTVDRAAKNGELHVIWSWTGEGWRARPEAIRDWQDRGMPTGTSRSRCSSRPEDAARDDLAVA